MRKHPYNTLLERKRKWTPVQGTKGTFRDGSEETIKRALAVRHMELPVGAFIQEGLEKTVPDNARRLLESNVQDEIKHDIALQYIVNAIGADENAEKEGKLLRDAWIAHPDHTITKLWSQNGPSSSFYSLCLGLMGMLLFALYLPISPGTSRSMSERILLYVMSWVYLLLLLWINLGRPPLTGFFNLYV